MMKKLTLIGLMLLLTLIMQACQRAPESSPGPADQLEAVTLMLDWVPNTNHTGIFVAEARGFFREAGLQVDIIEPGEVYAEQAVSSGAVEFGVSFQEQVTLARASGIPLVSVAAIIQHNTSAFAARGELQVNSPADWDGLRYGSFGSPFEEPTLRVLMTCAGGDFSDLEVVETGFADPLALLSEAQTDLAWIFYGWQGVQADLQGLDLDLVMMEDWFDCIPDYYTPVFISSEAVLRDRPGTARAFLEAITRGYEFAIEDPDTAAEILLEAVPELDSALVSASQTWISPRYQADAPRWGEQRPGVWEAYSSWMLDNGIITAPIDVSATMTNEFLP
jgi:ABC-type nitrate/sulfonate/bicarbonate transport system substrate-binding protein